MNAPSPRRETREAQTLWRYGNEANTLTRWRWRWRSRSVLED